MWIFLFCVGLVMFLVGLYLLGRFVGRRPHELGRPLLEISPALGSIVLIAVGILVAAIGLWVRGHSVP